MSGATVGRIARAVERLAPLETCADFDNSGLMLGHPDDPVNGVLLAMEADPFTVREAMETGCDMILAHHPLFLDPIKTLRADTPAGETVRLLIEHRIALYCAHTNFDRCPVGTSRALAQACGVQRIETRDFLAFGPVQEQSSAQLAQRLRTVLSSQAVCVFGERPIARVCVCAGSGNGELTGVLESGADAFVCGELKYHQMTEYLARGVAVVTCGHRESEAIALPGLMRHLQNDEDLVQYQVRYRIASGAYGIGPAAARGR